MVMFQCSTVDADGKTKPLLLQAAYKFSSNLEVIIKFHLKWKDESHVNISIVTVDFCLPPGRVSMSSNPASLTECPPVLNRRPADMMNSWLKQGLKMSFAIKFFFLWKSTWTCWAVQSLGFELCIYLFTTFSNSQAKPNIKQAIN